MPQVHHVKRARKVRRKYGIRRGTEYWWWSVRLRGSKTSTTYYSLTPPKMSQVVTSKYKKAYWKQVESFQYWCRENPEGLSGIVEGLNDCALCFYNLAQEQIVKAESMPPQLQGGKTVRLLQSRAEQCEEAATSIEELIAEVTAVDYDLDLVKQTLDAYLTCIRPPE